MSSVDDILHLNYSGIKRLTDSDLRQDAYKNAKRLYLKRNLIKHLPPSIGHLTALVEMHLDCNELQSLPKEIGALYSLETLNVSANRLEILPPAIGKLGNLCKLSISDNRLTNIPKEIGNLKKLVTLEASRNLIATLPTELSLCKNLELLALDKNQLTCLPRQLGNLQRLTELSLCGNFLEYIPQTMAWMPTLKYFYLDNNPALSTLPLYFEFSRLKEIGLHGCHREYATLNEKFHHIYVDGKPVAIPEGIQQVCSAGSECVPLLHELAMRAVYRSVDFVEDIPYLPLPDSIKARLSDPSAKCDNCSAALFSSAFPVVFVNDSRLHLLALMCSLDCVNKFYMHFRSAYPFRKTVWQP